MLRESYARGYEHDTVVVQALRGWYKCYTSIMRCLHVGLSALSLYWCVLAMSGVWLKKLGKGLGQPEGGS